MTAIRIRIATLTAIQIAIPPGAGESLGARAIELGRDDLAEAALPHLAARDVPDVVHVVGLARGVLPGLRVALDLFRVRLADAEAVLHRRPVMPRVFLRQPERAHLVVRAVIDRSCLLYTSDAADE